MLRYYETRDIAEILGCSVAKARQIMFELPHLRVMKGKGSKVRVKIEDFEQYLETHTVQPDELQEREFNSIEEETKAWHKGG